MASLEDGHIMPATRVQQGDPIGSLLFDLVLHLIINQIRDKCKLLLHVWCLDDETIIRGLEKVAKAHDIIRDTVPRLGLELNICKIEILWLSCDGSKLHGGWVVLVRY